MKKTSFLTRFFACAMIVSALFAITAFADDVTKQKLSLTYNEADNTIEMNFYIAKGTAIVGYCSFDYDSDILTLLDVDGNELPDVIPDKTDDGSIYLERVITGRNGVTITDVGKGSSKLINTTDGHLFFAWFLPHTIPYIDATSSEVLIATATFELKEDADPEDLDADCVKVAGKDMTDKISGWFAGLVVLDKNQKRYSYDGTVSGTALFESELIIDGEKQDSATEQPDEDDAVDTDTETPSDDSAADTDTEAPSDDGVVDTDTETPSDDGAIDTDTETPSDDDTVDTDTETPSDDDTVDTDTEAPSDDTVDTDTEIAKNNDIEIAGKAQVAVEVDFNLSLNADEGSVKVKWVQPEKDGIISYTIFLLDDCYNQVRKVSGISSISSSYTVSNLASSRKYFVYVIAKAGESYYSSEMISFETDSDDTPTTLVSNVFYDGGEGYLYGLSSELCVFGKAPTKTPTVIAPDGKVFIGWSVDEENLIDVQNTKIYSDTLFYAVYSDKKDEGKSYINGYDDGTFKPYGNITRAEAAVIISRLCDDYDKDKVYSHNFSDVQAGYWYENAVAYCYQKGYIKGYEDGTFNPYGNITRAEFATILYRVFGFDKVLGINVFSDLENHWGKNAVSILYGAGVATPDEMGNFSPDEKLTRKDAVSFIARSMNTIPDREAILDEIRADGYRFSDVPQYSEYFFDIYSALMN